MSNPEVASRLRNPPGGKSKHNLLEEEERTWDLITRAEVETRLGYAVTKLPRDEKWGDLDVGKVKEWLCIPAMIQYTIWSDVYRCEGFITFDEPTGKVSTRGKNAGKPIVTKKRVARGCGRELVLWNVAVESDTSGMKDEFECPHCRQLWTKYDLDFVRSTPVHIAIDFVGVTGRDVRVYRPISARELGRVSEIEQQPIPNWYPNAEIYPYRELMSMGVTKHGVSRISDFYTKRNLHALAHLWAEASKCSDDRIRRATRFILTSTFGRIERTTCYNFRRRGNKSLSALLYIASITVEDNIRRQLETKLDQCIVAFKQVATLRDCFDSGEAAVVTGSAETLGWLHDSSVDYIFADPPFGGNIFYADASMLYEAWLGETTDERRELVFHRRSKQQRQKDGYIFKTVQDYGLGMAGAFREMYRVLKPGRWATIEFNNSDGTVFEAIKSAVRRAGFEIVNMLLLDKDQKTFKQLQGAEGTQDVVDKDVLFNLYKPAAARAEVRAEDNDLEQQLADAVRQHLQTLPERIKAEPAKYNDEHRTTATINSMLMNALIPRGVSVERLNLPFIERVCSRYFRKIGQRWYLRGEAAGGHGGDLVQEEIAVKDELTAIAWLRQKLESRPALIGELKPHWMKATGLLPATVSQALDLENLLLDNFWRDAATNRWREPTPEERERMNDDRSLRVLHDADRLIAGSLDRSPSNAELCDWIKVLFDTCKEIEEGGDAASAAHRGFDKTEGYQLIVKLSHRLSAESVELATFNAARKQASVAGRRLAEASEPPSSSARPGKHRDDGQTVLDLFT